MGSVSASSGAEYSRHAVKHEHALFFLEVNQVKLLLWASWLVSLPPTAGALLVPGNEVGGCQFPEEKYMNEQSFEKWPQPKQGIAEFPSLSSEMCFPQYAKRAVQSRTKIFILKVTEIPGRDYEHFQDYEHFHTQLPPHKEETLLRLKHNCAITKKGWE